MVNYNFANSFQIIGAIAFLLLISIIYLRKPKKNTIENILYSILIVASFIVLILTADSLLVPYIYPNDEFTQFVYKMRYVFETIWFGVFIIYALVSSSKMSQGYVEYKDNKKKSYFNKIIFSILGIIALIVILEMSFDIDISMFTSNADVLKQVRIVSKMAIISILIWLFASVYYLILRMKYEKTHLEPSKDASIFRIILIGLVALVCILSIIIVRFETSNNIFIQAIGTTVVIKSIFFAIGALAINIRILTVAERISPKKFIPFIIFLPMYILAAILEIYYPDILYICVIFAIETGYLYFTMENPDEKLIEELNANKASAEAANSQKTRFLSVMSHEIRTPLNAIVGFGQTLKEADISDEAKEEVEDIIVASNNLIDIVNGILDISKIETDELEIVEKEYDSSKMFREIVALAKARLASAPIELRVNIDSTIPPVLYGDYLRVKQVIVNLLTNAIKYTKEGYINFTVNSLASGDKVILDISVKDTGMGIKPEDLSKLFTKFQRLDLEKNSSTEGTGLGLAITKRLVELMHGEIKVDSIYGEGTTFSIKLEQGIIHKSSEDIAEEQKKRQSIAKVDPNSRVLVVDDNQINLKVFCRLLQDYKLSPDTANSGEEAINKIKGGSRYDLIFLDDMMPNLTGTETLKILKEMPEFNTPVIAFTANAISGMREQYLASGFNEYLPKPVKKDALNELLDLFLNGRNIINTSPATVRAIPNLKVAAGYDVSITEVERKEERNDSAARESAKEAEFVDVNMHNPNHTKQFLESNKVDVNHGLGILGDMDTYNMLMDEFNISILERITKIKEYKDSEDWENYAIETHDLKKDAKYLGFTTLAEISYQHEKDAKEGNVDGINKTYENLILEINRIMDVVKKYCGK